MVNSKDAFLEKIEVAKVLKNMISQMYFFDVSEITSTTTFDQDLLTDSITFNELIDLVEEDFTSRSFGFKIDAAERVEIETVGDLIQLVCRRVCDPKGKCLKCLKIKSEISLEK